MINKDFEIIYQEEISKIEFPNLILKTEWKNYMNNLLEVRIHGYGITRLIDVENNLTGDIAGRTKVETAETFQIQSNASRKMNIILELEENIIQIFKSEKVMRVQANVPITLCPIGVSGGSAVRSNITIRTPDHGTILEFKLQ